MSNFPRVSAGFVLAIRSALDRAEDFRIQPQKNGMFRERTVCKGLTRHFGDLTGGALLTVVVAERLRNRLGR